jgi:GNAT superfamily N-acetyltransferase/protein tyrosine phosphatase (PTP) superfamily phosphohydrolase (DUF442 family)
MMEINDIRHFQPVTATLSSSGQPTAEQFNLIAQAGYKHVINLAMPDHPEGLPAEATRVQSLDMRYHAIPVPFDAPRRHHYEALSTVLNDHPNDKIWIHCILNYRVSALLFNYLQASAGFTAQVAKASVFNDWQADANWQQVWQWPSTAAADIQYRDYQPTDLPALLTVFQRAVHQATARDYSPAQRLGWAPQNPDIGGWIDRLSCQHVFIGQTPQQQLVGFIGIDVNGFIDLLFTDPVMQGWGIATGLLGHAEHWARQQGISLLTTNASITAKGFFEKHGFVITGEQTIYRHHESLKNHRIQRRI